MATEIERKFLLASDAWRPEATQSSELRQGYLAASPEITVRVRVSGSNGLLTIKGKTQGISRSEYEYAIPLEEAHELLTLCPSLVEKTRHLVPSGRHLFEIDEFHGENHGLIVAEVELSSEAEDFIRPAWLGAEVSKDHRYSNSSLADRPFSTWITPARD